VDPDKSLATREAGATPSQLSERAWKDEFAPAKPTLAFCSDRILTDDPVARNFTQHESIVESGHTKTVAPLMGTSLVLSR
jgi:hypothetical protein